MLSGPQTSSNVYIICCLLFPDSESECVGDGFESSLERIDGIRFYDLHLHYKHCVHMVA